MGIHIGIGGLKIGRSGGGSWTPQIPTGLTLTVISNTEIKLDWTNVDIKGTGVSIERSTDGVTYTELITVALGVSTYSNTTLTGNFYWYRIRAYKGTKYSGYSNVATNPLALIIYDGNTAGVFDSQDLTTITKDANHHVTRVNNKLGVAESDLSSITGTPHWSVDGILLDGVSDLLKSGAFIYNQPVFRYLALRQVTWTNNDYLVSGVADIVGIGQRSATPIIQGYAGSYSGTNNNLVINKFGIIRLLANGLNSKFCVNATAPWTGNMGAKVSGGIVVGGLAAGTYTSNIEYKGEIARKIADTAPNEAAIYKSLKNMTGLFEVGVLGDSTVAAYSSQNAVSSYLSNKAILYDVATTGETINQQLARYNALTTEAKSFLDYVFLHIGLNDLDPAESAATALGRYQAMVDDARTNSPQAKIIVATMTPCKARLITLYGGVNGLVAYQKWLDMNEAIRGNGANAITGADDYIDSHTDSLNDGVGNLAAAYEIVGLVDGIHENNAGREIIASAWTTKL